VIIWTRVNPLYYSGNMGYPPGTPADKTVHMMTVKWNDKKNEFQWYVECDNGHIERGANSDHEEAQEECEEAAKRLRVLPSVYEDEEEEEVVA